MSVVYFCCKQNRREAVLAHPTLNGIDFLEVLDDPALPVSQRQRTLFVHFLKPLAAGALAKENVRLEGGERIRNVAVASVTIGPDARVLNVQVNKPGDFSTYTLSVVSGNDANSSAPPDGFDSMLSAVDFSFKIECPSDFDCQTPQVCPSDPQLTPDIDYLAKDYASFRQLMLDRMTVLMPQWQERNVADLGVTLVELLAYAGDYLSYEQDSIATEAYLGTAQRRVSIRRHSRLVDYFMHDGCNARVWVQVLTNGAAGLSGGAPMVSKGTQLLTKTSVGAGCIDSATLAQALRERPETFETMHDLLLFAAHNELNFYTWGDERCCLPKDATRATLQDDPTERLRLRPGDVLIFEERLGPNSGLEVDADPTRRHAVRLTRVVPEATSVLGQQTTEIDRTPGPLVTDALTSQAIVEIEWAAEDALPFPFCISAVTDDEHQTQDLANISVALGNIVLADHGITVPEQLIGTVPAETLFRARPVSGDRCLPRDRLPVPPRFRPSLQNAPLTMAATVEITETLAGQTQKDVVAFDATAPASAAFHWEMQDALPVISLNGDSWHPQRDLLASDSFAAEFVVEVEENGFAALRFGDDQHGRRPQAQDTFFATYRVGNGTRGNIGPESLVNIVIIEPAISGVRNPLPASGGVDPETIEHVRQSAPSAFRIQERAVTPADYAEVAERHPGIQQAAATFRWTGSWRTVFLTVDRLAGLEVKSDFKDEMRAHMERYRMAGHDLEIDGPLYVSLEIEMTVCVKADYFRGDVKAALLQVFSNRVLPDGTRGVFHPDNFSFGQTVYLSRLYAAAMKVEGVAAVRITTFQRQASPDPEQLALKADKLTLGRLEIARLDNDPNFPERGVFHLNVEDGK
jgi:hypothetical protein